MNIDGKKILVTGGGSGYGKGIAGVLAKCGAEVWITGRREDKLQSAAAELGVKYCCADVANPSDWDKVISLMGGIDVLVNNHQHIKRLCSLCLARLERLYRSQGRSCKIQPRSLYGTAAIRGAGDLPYSVLGADRIQHGGEHLGSIGEPGTCREMHLS